MGIVGGFIMSVQALRRLNIGCLVEGSSRQQALGVFLCHPDTSRIFCIFTGYNGYIADETKMQDGHNRGFIMSVQALRRLTLGVWLRGAAANKLWGYPFVIPTPAGYFVFSRVTIYV